MGMQNKVIMISVDRQLAGALYAMAKSEHRSIPDQLIWLALKEAERRGLIGEPRRSRFESSCTCHDDFEQPQTQQRSDTDE